jgi:RNA polymerase sigma-70 factor (ECF subfamily)
MAGSWLTRVMSGKPGSEREIVDRYSHRLLQLARQQLPDRLRRRLDPEDVVQSVYRSFFLRLSDGQFSFEDSHDVWRLLSVMTYHKVQYTVRHHQRGRRDVRRELAGALGSDMVRPVAGATDAEPGPADVAMLFDCLENLLHELPENYREIVALRLQGESIADIAKKINRSQRTVLRILANVRDSAASELEPTP